MSGRWRPCVQAVAAVLAVVVGLGGCSAGADRPPSRPAVPSVPAVPTPPPTPVDPGPDPGPGTFELRPPPGWVSDPDERDDADLAAAYRAPDPVPTAAGPFWPNITVTAVPGSGVLDGLLDDARDELAQLPDHLPTADLPLTLPDGTPAHLFGGAFTDRATGVGLRNLQLYAAAGRSVWIVTGTAPAYAWPDQEAALDAALRSFRPAG